MEMARGFNLVGSLTVLGEYGRDAKMASLEVDTLRQLAPFLQARAFQLTRPSEDASADRDVWDATMKEVERGCLSETTVVELNTEFRGEWIPSRRFGVRQKSKTRVIDDFSASQVNSCVTVPEKLKLEGVDDLLYAHSDFGTAQLLRVALAIRIYYNILLRLFRVMACNYYDDYPVVSSRSMCRNTDQVVSDVFDLLGFTLTTDPDK
eukprot:5122145-Amphidinium_carterae.1